MTSAVLPRMMNESSNWGHVMAPNPHFHSNPNPNNQIKKRHKKSHDFSPVNQPSTSQRTGNFSSIVSFKVSSFSKAEIRQLRKRLSLELNQVRVVINRIESGQFGNAGTFQPKPIDWSVLLKECGKILTKLLKHKFAYVFKNPVDVVGLQLHDYYTIVKRPMDLGTVRANLGKKFYFTPMEFAGDVRLTFNNALLYNPKTNEVNGMAEQMLARFEELFRPILENIEVLLRRERGVQELGVVEPRVFNPLPSPRRTIKNTKPRSIPLPIEVPVEVIKKPIERMQQQQRPVVVNQQELIQFSPPAEVIKKPIERMQQPQMPVVVNQHELIQEQFSPPLDKELKGVGRPGVKQSKKPRARDEIKREMSLGEKHKLGFELQNVPEEKMPQLVQIIKKRNGRFAQDADDEVELDIETLDNETLWELDRFVTNWKKYLSKNKRQSMSNPTTSSVPAPFTPVAETDMGVMSDKNNSVKELKDNDDEDVDIDDDMPATHFPTIEIEKDEVGGAGEDHEQGQDQKDNGNASSSSSSSGSSDSSSSSGTDSGSSSGSDSEADEAQS